MRRIIVTVAVISHGGCYEKPTTIAKHLQFERMYTVHRTSFIACHSITTRVACQWSQPCRDWLRLSFVLHRSSRPRTAFDSNQIQKKKKNRVGRATLGCPGTPGATVNAT
jgi:hypothetical protein